MSIAITALSAVVLTETVLAETEELAPLIMPTWAFPLIAALGFLLLAFVTWSYRDVANRQSGPAAGPTATEGRQAESDHGTGGAH